MTSTYQGIIPVVRIQACLAYLSVIVNEEAQYTFNLPDPFDDVSEAHFDNLIWTDGRTKPLWSELQAVYLDAWEWGQTVNLIIITPKDRTDDIIDWLQSTITYGLANVDNTADSAKSFTANQVSNASTIGKTILTAANDSAVRTAIMSTQTHIADPASNNATNATTSLATNYNLATGVLGLANAMNTTNTAINDLGTMHNTLAANDNDMADKIALILNCLEANKLLNAA